MDLLKNQKVIFHDVDGSIFEAKNLEVSWSEKQKAFYIFSQIDNTRLLSNEVITIETKKRNYKKQTDTSKMQEIFPIGETEKAYIIEDESTYTTKTKNNVFTKCIAKSICVIENGKIFAPYFALK